jgi:hypothetical protein
MDGHLGIEIQGELILRTAKAEFQEVEVQSPAGPLKILPGFRV